MYDTVYRKALLSRCVIVTSKKNNLCNYLKNQFEPELLLNCSFINTEARSQLNKNVSMNHFRTLLIVIRMSPDMYQH
jgi:hypothetical protein